MLRLLIFNYFLFSTFFLSTQMAEENSLLQIMAKLEQMEPEKRQLLANWLHQETDPANALKNLQEDNARLKGEKEKFFSIISFWLGSPLNSLEMLAKMLVADVGQMPAAMVQEMASHLFKQVAKLKQNMGNLMTWADLEVENFTFSTKAVNLRSLVEKVLASHAEHAGKKDITLLNEVNQQLEVQAHADYLGQVIYNLVSNGLKFSLKEGSVTVKATAEAGKITISVADSGIGMGNAKLKNLYNTDRKSSQKGTAQEEGFGLGMVVCKALLDLHGSEMNIVSERGKGTTVTFSLAQG